MERQLSYKIKLEYYTWKDDQPIKSGSSHLNYQGHCLAG